MRALRAVVGFFLDLLQVVLQEVGSLIIALIRAMGQGLRNVVTGIFSSPVGIGALVFLAGYGVYVTRDQEAGAMLGLLGLLIAFIPALRRKKGKR